MRCVQCYRNDRSWVLHVADVVWVRLWTSVSCCLCVHSRSQHSVPAGLLLLWTDASLLCSGPREDATRIGSAGVVRRQAVDISPLRRVNQVGLGPVAVLSAALEGFGAAGERRWDTDNRMYRCRWQAVAPVPAIRS